MATRLSDGVRLMAASLVSRVSRLRHSRARALLSLNLKKKRLLAVSFQICAILKLTIASGLLSVPRTILKCHNSIHHAHLVSQPLDLCFHNLFFSKSFVHKRLILEVFTIPGAFVMPDV